MPPFGEACVCNPWSHRDPSGFAGGPGILLLTWSNKARQQDGILEGVGHSSVPAFPFLHGKRLSQEPL